MNEICMRNVEKGPRKPLIVCPYCKHRRYNDADAPCNCKITVPVGFLNRSERRRIEALQRAYVLPRPKRGLL